MVAEKKYDLIVSIVIYKPKLEQLAQTLNSLSNSQLKIKVLLFDNSPEKSDVKIFSCRHPLEYIFNNSHNLGFGKAHNQNIRLGIEQSNYFLILNPDVYFDEDILTELKARMDQDPSIGLCIPRICHPSGHVQIINRRVPRPQDLMANFINNKFKKTLITSSEHNRYLLKDIDILRPFLCPTVSGCFMLCRSEALKQVNGFDERYFLYLEDTDLSRRISEIYKVVVFSDIVAHHYWNRGAHKNIKLFMMFVHNLVRYFNKWGWIVDPKRKALNQQVQPYTFSSPETQRPRDSVWKNKEMFDSV